MSRPYERTSAGTSIAQCNRVARISQASQRFQLSGHVRPLATFANDLGRADSAERISNVTVNFAPTWDQQAALDDLLLRQRTPGTAEYQQWLTPEEFADRFGLSTSDMSSVRAWFEAQGGQSLESPEALPR